MILLMLACAWRHCRAVAKMLVLNPSRSLALSWKQEGPHHGAFVSARGYQVLGRAGVLGILPWVWEEFPIRGMVKVVAHLCPPKEGCNSQDPKHQGIATFGRVSREDRGARIEGCICGAQWRGKPTDFR